MLTSVPNSAHYIATLKGLIDDDVDTTTSATDCAYDRIIVSSALGAKVVEGSAMPYKFDAALGLSMEDAKVVSDEYRNTTAETVVIAFTNRYIDTSRIAGVHTGTVTRQKVL